jgi:hypothetical protein
MNTTKPPLLFALAMTGLAVFCGVAIWDITEQDPHHESAAFGMFSEYAEELRAHRVDAWPVACVRRSGNYFSCTMAVSGHPRGVDCILHRGCFPAVVECEP